MGEHFTRRDVILSSSIAAASALVGQEAGAAVRQGNVVGRSLSPAASPWFDRTMRWMQIALTEGDGGHYDPQWWLDLFRRAAVQGLCVNAGGVAAFYPTDIPFHHRAASLGGGDMFGDLVRPARRMGITIVARTDSQACLNDAAAAHPEWLNIDENGRPRRHKSFPDTRTITCAMGAYNFDFMTRVHREIAERYEIDGLFCNRWQAWARGMCYCPTCQSLFRTFSGLELPRRHADKEALLRYADWETARLTELWKLWDGEIRKARPTSRYFSNIGIDLDRAAELSPTWMCEAQSRGHNPPWAFGRGGKKLRTIFGPDKRIIGLSGMTFDSRHSVAPEAEVRMWLLNAITNGLSPWMIKSSARNWDDRWIPALERVYRWHARNEPYLRNSANLAEAAIMFRKDPPRDPLLGSGATTAVGGDKGIDDAGIVPTVPANDDVAAAGVYQALIEARIPFEMAYGGKLESADIDRFKVLILANLAEMSDAECDKLRQYVQRGGSLVATCETSLYRDGQRRADFGLADILGVSASGGVRDNGPNSYMRLDPSGHHPLLDGLGGTRQIVNAARHMEVKAAASFAPAPLRRIETYPTDPMEEIFPRVPPTDIPEVYARDTGHGGRVVYFPGDIDVTFARGMAPDLGRLIGNAVRWAAGGGGPVEVEGPGIVEVTCWRQPRSMTVHLFNCTNPFMLRAAYREDIPIGPQKVTVRLPAGARTASVRLLVAEATPGAVQSGDAVTLTIPSVVDHEVVAIDLA